MANTQHWILDKNRCRCHEIRRLVCAEFVLLASAQAALYSMIGRICTMRSFREWNAGHQHKGVIFGMWAVQHFLVARDVGYSPAAAVSVGLGEAWSKLGVNLLDIRHDAEFSIVHGTEPSATVLKTAEIALSTAVLCFSRGPGGCLGRQARTLNDLGRLLSMTSNTEKCRLSHKRLSRCALKPLVPAVCQHLRATSTL